MRPVAAAARSIIVVAQGHRIDSIPPDQTASLF